METIKKIANTIADRYVDELHQKIARSSAMEAAIEQQAIDINKACEWLLKNVYVKMDTSDAYCYLNSGWYHDFKKAMEE